MNINDTSILKEQVDALGDALVSKNKDLESRLEALSGEARGDRTVNLNVLQKSVEDTQKMMQSFMTSHMRPGTDITELSQKSDQEMEGFLRKGYTGGLETKNMSSADADGNFLVPEQTANSIHTKLTERSFMRQLARVTKVSSNRFESLVAGKNADVGWTDETSNRNETEAPDLESIRIVPHSLYARIRVTQNCIDDASVDVNEFVAEHVANQMAQRETEAFIKGDGNTCPKGLLAYLDDEGFNTQKTGVNGGFSEDNGQHALFDTVGSLKTPYLDQAVWIMSRSAAAEVRKLKDPNQMHFVWQAPQGSEKRAFLLGYPVYITDHMPAVAQGQEGGSILFGNVYEAYQIIDRQDISMLRDHYSQKPFVEFYTTKRVGGDMINKEAMVALRFTA